MSEWQRIVNNLKQRSQVDLFTTSQRQAWQALLGLLRYPEHVNLHGVAGSGKTFVAWALAQSLGAVHVPVPETLDDCPLGTQILLLDNAPEHEYDARRLLAHCNLLQAQSVALITRHPVSMPMRRVALQLPTEQEVKDVTLSISRLGYFQSSQLPPNPNFWNILQSFVQ